MDRASRAVQFKIGFVGLQSFCFFFHLASGALIHNAHLCHVCRVSRLSPQTGPQGEGSLHLASGAMVIVAMHAGPSADKQCESTVFPRKGLFCGVPDWGHWCTVYNALPDTVLGEATNGIAWHQVTCT